MNHKHIHTLSIQMPVADIEWTEYRYLFPDAYQRIHSAITLLQEKGVKKIYLLGHSMGAYGGVIPCKKS